MAKSYTDQLLRNALQQHQAGQLQQAEGLYRKVLLRDPNQADALRLLGLIANSVGRHDAAVDLLRRATAVRRNWPDATYDLGVALKAAGRLDEAIAAYRSAISLRARHFESHFNLALALREKGDLKGAIASYQKVIELNPNVVEAHYQLGLLWRETGSAEKAIPCFESAVALQPQYVEAWLGLGAALHAKEQLDEAITAFRRVIALQPDNAHAHNNLGAALREKKEVEESIAECREAVALSPGFAEAHVNLASSLKEARQFAEAEAAYQRAIALQPTLAEAYFNLGCLLQEQKQYDRSIAVLRQAVAINPNLAQAHSSMGNALQESGRYDEAITACRAALAIKPDLAAAWNCIGGGMKDSMRLDESIAAYRQAVRLDAKDAAFHSNLLFTLNYLPHCDARTIAEEHRRWDEGHAQPLRKHIQPHENDRNPGRRLRVGYVSPDFRAHVVCRFVLPLLAAHDHQQFEIFCYSSVAVPDTTTQHVREHADVWRDIAHLSDEKTAAMIREDRIDILVDLTGHTGGNRLPVFAQKPAPVQVTYVGYPATTGMQSMDYRLTDEFADPAGMTDALCTERLARLPDCAWCYQTPEDSEAVIVPPCQASGQITFGSFNNIAKVNQPLAKIWAKILRQVPGSRLLLKSPPLSNDSVRDRLTQMMLDAGIQTDRLRLVGSVPAEEHLRMYNQMDIALDTHPYHGTTTTCEALWMGVPVVTLAGQSHVSRVGVSLLSAVGAPELIATCPEQYVQIAADMANDRPRLARLRTSLRPRMKQSALVDGPRLARSIEAEYREMWRRWCLAEIRMTKPSH